MEGCVDIVWSRCQINGTDFSELVVTNTPKELRHIALGCRVSRLPRECVQETDLPRMGCFGVRDKAVSSLVKRRQSPIHSPVRIAPHDDISPKTHGLVEDSKTVALRLDGFL